MRRLAALAALAVAAHAGEMSGRIQYSPEVPIAEASITIIDTATGIRRTVHSNGEGFYRVAGVQPGLYNVAVRKQGFKTMVQMDVKLDVEELARLDFTMRLGSMEESITVTGEGDAVSSEDPSVGSVMRRSMIERLPLNGRGLLSLLEATPGTVVTPAAWAVGSGQFSVDGQRTDTNAITIDGVSVNGGIGVVGTTLSVRQSAGGALPLFTAFGSMHNLVSTEALEEFRLQTAPARVEAGRTPGAQLSLSTRSGTNQFHGGLFGYFRHDALDANDWFANRSGTGREPLQMENAGGSAGGPIFRDRTFFFFALDRLRLRQSAAERAEVPTAAAREMATPAVQKLLASLPYPASTVSGAFTGSYYGLSHERSTVGSSSIRIDHTLSGNAVAFGRWNHAPSADRRMLAAGAATEGLEVPADLATVGVDAAFSRAVNASVRLGYLATGESSIQRGFGRDNDPGFASAAGTPRESTGYWVIGGAPLVSVPLIDLTTVCRQRQWNLVGSAGMNRGRHTAQAGFDYRRVAPELRPHEYWLASQYQSFSSFLQGQFSSMQVLQLAPTAWSLHNLSIYAGDAWKAGNRLTLSFGLRVELNPPPVASTGYPVFAASTLAEPRETRSSNDGRELWRSGYRGVAPRLSIAFRPRRRGGPVIRGSVGRYYDLGFGSAIEIFPPSGAVRMLYSLAPGQPYVTMQGPGITTSTSPLAADFRIPYTWRWNVTLEQAITSHATASLAYVGSAGERLLRGIPDRTGAQVIATDGHSRYRAMLFHARIQAASELQASLSFAWSHSTDNASTPYAGAFSGNERSSRLNVMFPPGWGDSNFDARLSASAALVYEPRRLRGWSLDGILRARAGFPLNVYDPSSRAGLFVQPDVVAGQPLWIADPEAAGGRRLNPAAFAAPAPGSQGTLERNALRGPGAAQVDLALGRRFQLSDRTVLRLRLEAFNVFNHPSFGNPDGVLNSDTFGRSTAMLNRHLGSGNPVSGLAPALQAGGPRSMQLAVRLLF